MLSSGWCAFGPGYRAPGSEIRVLGSGFWGPGSGLRELCSWGYGVWGLGSGRLALGCWLWVLGPWRLCLGAGLWVLGPEYWERGTWNTRRGARTRDRKVKSLATRYMHQTAPCAACQHTAAGDSTRASRATGGNINRYAAAGVGSTPHTNKRGRYNNAQPLLGTPCQ